MLRESSGKLLSFGKIPKKSLLKFSKIQQNSGKMCEILAKINKNSSIFKEHFQIRELIPKKVQRSALCRSRRELSNEYLLPKFGFDTAENEPCKICRTQICRRDAFELEW